MALEGDLSNLDSGGDGQSSAFQAAVNVMAAVGTVWIFAIMLLIVADVLGRNFLDRPITGVAEIAGRSVVAIVFLQIASAVAAGRMTRADFLIRIVEVRAPALARGLNALFALVGAAVFALIAYSSFPELAESWRTNDFFGIQGIFTVPSWPFWAITVGGSIVAAVAYVIAMTAAFVVPSNGSR
jgi:TRAP-type C4-dicarboxylate transport system permease small subunit